jgi:hypothetical protein
MNPPNEDSLDPDEFSSIANDEDHPNEDELDELDAYSSLANAEDHLILMHRDAHFGGSFEIMLQYYEEDGKGAMQEFDLARIHELQEYEKQSGKDLAGTLLSGAEAEKVAAARKAYKTLKELYENTKETNPCPRLIADLILSEEEHPKEEIDAILNQKGIIVPFLIDLLRSEDFYDPLFPGYGQAPTLAAHCLGLIGDKRAMFSLFEAIGEANFFSEDNVLDSLKQIGDPAKEFLMRVVQSEPLNFDNERAAIALVRFKEDPQVAECCFKMLSKPVVWKDPALAVHLILACEGLKNQEDQQQFAALAANPAFPKILVPDIRLISKIHAGR